MQLSTKTKDKPIVIHIWLFDAFSNLCLANIVEPLRAANRFTNQTLYDWKIFSIAGQTVTSSSGIAIMTQGPIAKAGPCDRLFIVSSYNYEECTDRDIIKLFKSSRSQATEIAGFDTAAWLMAAAGILDDKTATIHWDVTQRFQETFLNVTIYERPFVIDGNIMTCGGAMAAFDLILSLVSRDFGDQLKFDVERLFRFSSLRNLAPSSTDPGRRSLTADAIEIMRAHLENPLPINKICEQLECSPKMLERRFQRRFGMTPGRLYKRLRLSSVREFIETTNISMAEISVRSGYKNASAMSRAFRKEYGYAPSKLRG